MKEILEIISIKERGGVGRKNTGTKKKDIFSKTEKCTGARFPITVPVRTSRLRRSVPVRGGEEQIEMSILTHHYPKGEKKSQFGLGKILHSLNFRRPGLKKPKGSMQKFQKCGYREEGKVGRRLEITRIGELHRRLDKQVLGGGPQPLGNPGG